MTRSFRTFLLDYCQDMAGLKTSSLKRLFNAAMEGSPRVFEPLMLYALCDGREKYLIKQSIGTNREGDYRSFLEDLEKSNKTLKDYLATLSEGDRYKRAYIAWLAEIKRKEQDKTVLSQVAQSISSLIDNKGITRAEACRIAKVNKGNFYAFLKGDTSKMKRDTAVNVYKAIDNA